MIILCGFAVSNYYNKLKLLMLEKGIIFEERLVYPWQRDTFLNLSPLGKIPFIETEFGGLSESQIILDYLESRFPEVPMYPDGIYQRAKCRELIQHIELNAEWVARRLYRQAFFGGQVTDETKQEVDEKMSIGLGGIARLASFSPFIFGPELTAADCAAYMHFNMIKASTVAIYGESRLEPLVPGAADYIAFMGQRSHVKTVLAGRDAALAAFIKLNVKYDG